MAYDLKKLISSVERTPESIRKMADKILSGEVAASGTSTLMEWAKMAVGKLDDYEKYAAGRAGTVRNGKTTSAQDAAEEALSKAYEWITGKAQPHKAERMYQKNDDAIRNLAESIANEASNLKEDPSRDQEKFNNLKARADVLGLDFEEAAGDIVQTASGAWIPRSNAVKNDETTAAKNAAARMREGQTTTVRQGSDGSWEIVGADGTVLETGLASEAGASARQQERQGGSLPQITGTTTTATPEALAALDASGTGTVDTEGLTQEQIDAINAAGDAASGSYDLLGLLTITDEDISKFLETAKSEYDPYYTQLFSRASEDFTTGLEYAAEERKAALAREAMDKQAAMEQTAASSADAGIATSGIRKKAEARLAAQAEDIASSSRRKFAYDTYQAGRSAEDVLGSSTISGLTLPTINGESVYTAAGGITGSLERERTTAEQTRASELARQDALATIASLPEADVAIEDIASLL